MPKFDPSQQLKKVDAEFEPLLQSAGELEAFSKKRGEEIQAEIAAIDAETVRFSPCANLPVRIPLVGHQARRPSWSWDNYPGSDRSARLRSFTRLALADCIVIIHATLEIRWLIRAIIASLAAIRLFRKVCAHSAFHGRYVHNAANRRCRELASLTVF